MTSSTSLAEQEPRRLAPAPRPAAPDRMAAVTPIRGIDRLGELAVAATTNGLPTRVTLSGQALAPAAAVQSAIYRIAEETLAVALERGSRGSAVVSLTDIGRHLILDIVDMSPAGAPLSHDGLASMRERATSVGGVLEAGPGPLGGFRVRAQLPSAR
jgi:signal transduction histidine kinase